MHETKLTLRAIFMVVLVFLMVMGGIIAAAFIVAPAREGPAVTRQVIGVSLTVAVLALVWFVWLAIQAVRERRTGVQSKPAKIGGWFHVCFGAIVALGGISCSALTYQTADLNDGMWTLYWGMIAWGVIQLFVGVWKVRHADFDAKVHSAGLPSRISQIRRGP